MSDEPRPEMTAPTPRTDAAWASSFEPCEYRAAHTARTMRDECERLETELARLRPELEKVYALVTPDGCDLPMGIFETAQAVSELRAERDQFRAEVKSCGELSCDECNARTAALTAERDQLRAEVELDEALQLRTESSLKTAIARAERAEAFLRTIGKWEDAK